jgi:hypothetical protein
MSRPEPTSMDDPPVILHFRAAGTASPEPRHVIEADLPALPFPTRVSLELWPAGAAPAGCLPLPCAPGWSVALVIRSTF